ncbi:agglutinin Isolectin 1 [Colletotrichum plurivorum]|uniref:Agglutinin Isolectin 1 n=1 Tax=Colletotrichum plurivorum TaxID=2175906 RepID=A0A8H6K1D3_9PEZI|nr:agglutinin Isolectin 1 [Colletotrichum plurivorum]
MLRSLASVLLLSVAAVTAVVSTDNSCGGSRGLTCPGSLCCSQYNWCGVSNDHCGAGCQSAFGRCTTTSSGSTKITPDGSCGGTNAYTCTGGTFGNCCSQWGFCGNSDQHCFGGCQSTFGDCSSSSVGGKTVSTDGSCAGTKGFTCQGSSYGNCCSQWGFCGSSTAHCASGCQASFGTCSGSGAGASGGGGGGAVAASSSAARPASTGAITSPDNSCGGSNRYTCPSGTCCSKNGWCGTGSDFCGFGCQTSFSPNTCSACPAPACAGTVSGNNPTCSTNNNFCWTVSSKRFQITCGRLASGDYLTYVDATSFGDCISKCAANSGCVAASFYQGASTSCSLYSSYQGPASGNSAGGIQSHAFVRPAACT